jgi:hypothetical protein
MKRRKFLYTAPKLIFLGALILKKAKADLGSPPSDPNVGW